MHDHAASFKRYKVTLLGVPLTAWVVTLFESKIVFKVESYLRGLLLAILKRSPISDTKEVSY